MFGLCRIGQKDLRSLRRFLPVCLMLIINEDAWGHWYNSSYDNCCLGCFCCIDSVVATVTYGPSEKLKKWFCVGPAHSLMQWHMATSGAPVRAESSRFERLDLYAGAEQAGMWLGGSRGLWQRVLWSITSLTGGPFVTTLTVEFLLNHMARERQKA